MLLRYFFVLLASSFLFGCSQDVQAPDEHTSYTQVGTIEDIPTPQAKRVIIRIKVPLGRSKEELTTTLERAARETEDKTKANAIIVFAYRPQDKADGSYSVGMAEYAPNGVWGDAAKSEPMGPMQINVKLNDLYFAPPNNQIAVNSLIKLKANSTNKKIGLSREYGSWGDEDIITTVPFGTVAKVLEVKSQPIGSSELVRYRVILNENGTTGWVHEWNIK